MLADNTIMTVPDQKNKPQKFLFSVLCPYEGPILCLVVIHFLLFALWHVGLTRLEILLYRYKDVGKILM